MLTATNLWMALAGFVYLAVGILVARNQIGAARGWDKIVALAPAFIAAALAAFAPEHFVGPAYVQDSVPSWMPAHAFWAHFVGCALLAAATSLALQKFVRLSAALLGCMFLLFVCTIYLPNVLAHPIDRFAWAYMLRDLSFAAGAWALAGLHSRTSFPHASSAAVLFARFVLAAAALDYGVQHFLHPGSAPGVPLEMLAPAWVPFPPIWACMSGVILLLAGIGLTVNKHARLSAAAIGTLMTALTLVLFLPILLRAGGPSSPAFSDAINYAADTLLYAGSALAVASALPQPPPRS